jgi:hypothetical protein
MNEGEVVLIKTNPLRLAVSLTISCLVVAGCVWVVIGPGQIFRTACILLVAI